MTNLTPNPEDTCKYIAALVSSRLDWVIDEIGGSECDDEHQVPLDALEDFIDEVKWMASQFGDLRRYSDGREVKSRAEVENHFVVEHLWHPTPGVEKPLSWSGTLLHDPGTVDRGLYTVDTDPETQDVHICVVRTDLL